jgi:hypothetical protein
MNKNLRYSLEHFCCFIEGLACGESSAANVLFSITITKGKRKKKELHGRNLTFLLFQLFHKAE